MINVTKSFLPPIDEYKSYLDKIWASSWLTNNGPLVQELEKKLKNYLGVKHLFFCGNGTIAIQIALKALDVTGEIITTPFSYVATTTSILWENCTPVFVDINESDFNIDADKIEAAITPNTKAILAVHVYGNPCQVEKIEAIAAKHHLKVIYDGAHAFGATYKDKQILQFGDVSTCSFHATKLFHTVEGGAIITNDDEVARKIMLYRQFGHVNDDYFSIGVNGKNSEMHAAMGLCVYNHLDEIIADRKNVSGNYDNFLNGIVTRPVGLEGTHYNYAYYPVLFKTEAALLKVMQALKSENIVPRRYFYPSLNQLPYLTDSATCPVSEDISRRVLSLPLFVGLSKDDVERISTIIKTNI